MQPTNLNQHSTAAASTTIAVSNQGLVKEKSELNTGNKTKINQIYTSAIQIPKILTTITERLTNTLVPEHVKTKITSLAASLLQIQNPNATDEVTDKMVAAAKETFEKFKDDLLETLTEVPESQRIFIKQALLENRDCLSKIENAADRIFMESLLNIVRTAEELKKWESRTSDPLNQAEVYVGDLYQEFQQKEMAYRWLGRIKKFNNDNFLVINSRFVRAELVGGNFKEAFDLIRKKPEILRSPLIFSSIKPEHLNQINLNLICELLHVNEITLPTQSEIEGANKILHQALDFLKKGEIKQAISCATPLFVLNSSGNFLKFPIHCQQFQHQLQEKSSGTAIEDRIPKAILERVEHLEYLIEALIKKGDLLNALKIVPGLHLPVRIINFIVQVSRLKLLGNEEKTLFFAYFKLLPDAMKWLIIAYLNDTPQQHTLALIKELDSLFNREAFKKIATEKFRFCLTYENQIPIAINILKTASFTEVEARKFILIVRKFNKRQLELFSQAAQKECSDKVIKSKHFTNAMTCLQNFEIIFDIMKSQKDVKAIMTPVAQLPLSLQIQIQNKILSLLNENDFTIYPQPFLLGIKTALEEGLKKRGDEVAKVEEEYQSLIATAPNPELAVAMVIKSEYSYAHDLLNKIIKKCAEEGVWAAPK